MPAVVDEVINRSEFLTAYAGEPYEDHGRFQALFQYQSLMAELLNMDVVNVPTYDGFQATATALTHGRPHDRPPRHHRRERRAAGQAQPRARLRRSNLELRHVPTVDGLADAAAHRRAGR